MPNQTGRPKVFCTHKCANAFFNPERYRSIDRPPAGLEVPENPLVRRCVKSACRTPLPPMWTRKQCLRCDVEQRLRIAQYRQNKADKRRARNEERLAAHDILAAPKPLNIEE